MRDIKNFFTAEDFSIKAALSSGETVELHGFALQEYQIDIRDLVTIQANQLLREYIEQLPVVYGHKPNSNGWYPPEANVQTVNNQERTHRARLVAIEEKWNSGMGVVAREALAKCKEVDK